MANGQFSNSTFPNLIPDSKYVRDAVYKNADLSPLFFLLQKRGRVIKETNKKFEFITVATPDFKFRIENVDNSATDLTVKTSEDTVKNIRVGDIIRNIITSEQMRVTKVAGKTITVVRGYGDKNEKVAVTGDENNLFINMGPAFEEGSMAPQGTIIPRGEDYNYCQTFRSRLKITRNQLNSNPEFVDNGQTSGQFRKNERHRVLKDHQNDIEKTLLFGVRNKSMLNDEAVYVTGGALSTIKSNVLTITDPKQFTVGTINKLIGKMSDAGFRAGNNKVLLYGSEFDDKLNSNVVNVFGGGSGTVITEYGLSINRVTTNFGKVDFIYNPVLSTVLPSSALLLDLDTIYLHMIDETIIKTNNQIPDYDGVVDDFLTDCGLEINNEAANGIIHLNF